MICWLDVETTGLDPKRDFPLEIGLVITDDELNVVTSFDSVIGWGLGALSDGGVVWERMMLNDGFVHKMHEKSGLLSAVKATQTDRWLVESKCIDFLAGASSIEKLVLGGSSIQFDRRFLDSWMPDLHDMFHYRSIDVSSVRELARRWCPDLTPHEPRAQQKHRVIPDIEDSIELARYYKQHLFFTITD